MTVEATVLDIVPFDVAHRTPVVDIDGEQMRGCDEFHTIDEFFVGETIEIAFSIRGFSIEAVSDEQIDISPAPKQFDHTTLNTWQHLVCGKLMELERGEERLTGTVDAGFDDIPFEILHSVDQNSDIRRQTAALKEGDFVQILAHKLYLRTPLDGSPLTISKQSEADRTLDELDADEIVKACRSESELLRKRAYYELARREEHEYADVLLEAKRRSDVSDAEHWVILDALKTIRDDRAISWFVEILEGDSNPYTMRKAAELIGDYRNEAGIEEAVKPLLALIRTAETDDLRYTAAHSLGRIGSTSLIPRLVSLLEEATDPRLRLAALQALGWMKVEESTLAIIDALDDPNPEVRMKAIWEVDTREDRRSVQPLVRLLREDDDEIVRERAADAFQTIGNAFLVQPQGEGDVLDPTELQPAFVALTEALHDPSPRVRQMAMLALSCHEAARETVETVIDESADETAVELARKAIQKIERSGVYENE